MDPNNPLASGHSWGLSPTPPSLLNCPSMAHTPSKIHRHGQVQATPCMAAVPSMPGTVPMMMIAPAAAPPFSSLMHVTAPTSGSPAGARVPVVRPWDMDAATAAGTFARTAPRPVPTFCRCNRRPHLFVRVGDTIEWVRPDLMKMVIYFNWSLNAEAEAHEPWEPRRE